MVRYRAFAAILVLLSALPAMAARKTFNLFEWTATAPIVVEARVLGEEGKYVLVHLETVMRGDLPVGTDVLVNLKEANRDRHRDLYPKPRRVEIGIPYVFLLERSRKQEQQLGKSIYSLVRGIHGVRDLPGEGAERVRAALTAFIQIQDQHSESITWRAFSEMLEQPNPIAIDTALQQFLKFRRGDPELSLSVRPLLDHPVPEIRASAARLVGQIVLTYGHDDVPEEGALRTELFAAARRDPVVEVRVAACEAMQGFSDRAVLAVLEEIADTDPEQEVRYTAEKLLHERRSRADRASR